MELVKDPGQDQNREGADGPDGSPDTLAASIREKITGRNGSGTAGRFHPEGSRPLHPARIPGTDQEERQAMRPCTQGAKMNPKGTRPKDRQGIRSGKEHKGE